MLAIGDIVTDAAKEKAAKYDVAAAGDVATVLDHPDVEIVVNLTIPAAHAEVATQAIAAGKHVWNEKPLALDRVSGREPACATLRRLGYWSAVRRTPSWVLVSRRPAGLSSRV